MTYSYIKALRNDCKWITNPQDRIAAGRYHTVILKSDGRVTAVGDNRKGQCEVNDWCNIVAVAAGD